MNRVYFRCLLASVWAVVMTCVLQAQKPVTPAPSRDNSKKTMTIITRTIDDNGNVTEERTIRPLKEGEEMQWNSSMDEDRSKSNSREKRIIIRKDDNDEVNIEDGNDEDIIINIPELKDLPEELQKELKGLDIRMLDDQGDDQGKKGFLGVVTESKGEGVSIEDVVKDSPAEKAGLKEGDIILSIDGKDVKSPDALFDAIRAHAPGDKVQVRVQHDGKESVKDITLDKVKELRIRTFNWNKGLPPDHFRMMCPEGGFDRMWGGMDAGDCEKKAWLGIEYRTTNKGLLVTDVMEKSPAQQAGFQPGDFIEKIDGAALKDGDDLKEILSKNKPGNQVRCGIRSEGQRKDITVQLANKCGKGKESMLLDKKERQLDKQNRRMEMEDRKMEKDLNMNLQVFPNPAHGEVTIEFSGESTAPVSLVVTDVQGKQLYKEEVTDHNGSFTRMVRLDGAQADAVIVHATQGKNLVTQKLIYSSEEKK